MEGELLYFGSNFTAYSVDNMFTGSDNGLAPKRQAIIWTNYNQVYWRVYASHDLDKVRER